MNTARYVFGVLIVTMMPPALVWWVVVHPFVGFWRRLGPRLALALLGVLGVASAGGLFLVRDRLLLSDLGMRWPLVPLAVALLAAAIAIARARGKHLTRRILSGVPELEEGGRGGVLLTEGIYGVIRNPRYVEVALGTFAYAVFANYVGAYLVALVTIPALHFIVLLEEKELADRFGAEYEAYRRRVPRYWPRRS